MLLLLTLSSCVCSTDLFRKLLELLRTAYTELQQPVDPSASHAAFMASASTDANVSQDQAALNALNKVIATVKRDLSRCCRSP